MDASSRWRTASMVVGALLIGSVLGPPLARAATAGLVRIEGGHSSNLAAVSTSGRLSVNAGLTTTAAGQVTVATTAPSNMVVASAGLFCKPGGFYAPPAGKALIITSADFLNSAAAPGNHNLLLDAGPKATPCTSILTQAAATDSEVSQNQVFNPGIPVPAGDALGLDGSNEVGAVEIYGYLVPAAAVPASALTNLRAGMLGELATGTPPR